MEQIDLDVVVRAEVGTTKVRGIRRQNLVPGIVYGGNQKPTAVKVSRKAYERIRREYHGQNVIFRLNVFEGDKKVRDYAALVKEEQHHPVSDQVIHIDFNRISLTDKITVKVAINAKGDAIGVKRDGGSLEHVLWELDIVCLPTQIPHHLEVDVTNLGIGDSVHVKDIVFPEGVTTKHDLEGMVMTVVPPMKEESAGEAPAAELEVIKEKKDKEPAAGEKKETSAPADKKTEEKKK